MLIILAICLISWGLLLYEKIGPIPPICTTVLTAVIIFYEYKYRDKT